MKILVAFDGSDAAKLALKFAQRLKELTEKLFVIYVTPAVMGTGPTFDSYVPSTVYVKQDEAAEKILQSAKDLLVDYPVETEMIKLDATGDQIAKLIVRTAEEKSADLIISGTRKLSGFSKVILGSVSSEIVKISHIPVLICPPE
ncbi:MAG: universal stress protein [Thermoplasmataceae archaeon]|jgi:nucleotide-binding universal stress UspA family protein